MIAGDADAEEDASVISGMSDRCFGGDTLGDASSEQRIGPLPNEAAQSRDAAPASAEAMTPTAAIQPEPPASPREKRGHSQQAMDSAPAGRCSPEPSQPLSCQTDDSFVCLAAQSPEATAEAVDGPCRTSAAELAGGHACSADGQPLSQQPLQQRQRHHRQQQRQPTHAPVGPAVEEQRAPAETARAAAVSFEGAAFREWLAKAKSSRTSSQGAGSCAAPAAPANSALRLIQENEGSQVGLEEQRWIMTARAGRTVLSCLPEHAAAQASAHITSRCLPQDIPWTLHRSNKSHSYAVARDDLSRRPCCLGRTYACRSVLHKTPPSLGNKYMSICCIDTALYSVIQ